MNIIAIIQARMNSSRLPGKVLLDIAGQPMLQRVVGRVRQARTLTRVVVATTDDPSDDPLAAFCQAQGFPHVRGSQGDVLDRFYQAARAYSAQVVVRITADCPLIDPELIDETVRALFSPPPDGVLRADPLAAQKEGLMYFDFAADRLPPPWPRTYPIGLDVEVCTFSALQRAWSEALEPHQREHVMPYLYEEANSIHYTQRDGQITPGPLPSMAMQVSNPFHVLVCENSRDLGALRWTVDTQADLDFVRAVYAHFENDAFSWQDVLGLLDRQPELNAINAGVAHHHYRDVDERSTHNQA